MNEKYMIVFDNIYGPFIANKLFHSVDEMKEYAREEFDEEITTIACDFYKVEVDKEMNVKLTRV